MGPAVARSVCRSVALLLFCLEIAHGLLLSGGVAQQSRRCGSTRQPRAALRMCAANLEPEEPGEKEGSRRGGSWNQPDHALINQVVCHLGRGLYIDR